MKYYDLRGRTPVPLSDAMQFARMLEARKDAIMAGGHDPWCVARTDFPDETCVSTVFLGINSINHSWRDGPPILFETMVFGGPLDGEQERCSTWEQAEAQHAAMVVRCEGGA